MLEKYVNLFNVIMLKIRNLDIEATRATCFYLCSTTNQLTKSSTKLTKFGNVTVQIIGYKTCIAKFCY
jgi:hypothetical protein